MRYRNYDFLAGQDDTNLSLAHQRLARALPLQQRRSASRGERAPERGDTTPILLSSSLSTHPLPYAQGKS